MADRGEEFTQTYRAHRLADQRNWYAARRTEFAQAERQGARVTSALLWLSAVAGALAALDLVWSATAWGVVGAGLAAGGSAVVAYRNLFAFDQVAKLYADAERSLDLLAASGEDGTALAQSAEGVMRREQGQWGQLVADLPLAGDDATNG
jgi:hypothetical protein